MSALDENLLLEMGAALDGPVDRRIIWSLECEYGNDDPNVPTCGMSHTKSVETNAQDVNWDQDIVMNPLPFSCDYWWPNCVSIDGNAIRGDISTGHNDWAIVNGFFRTSDHYTDEGNTKDEAGALGEIEDFAPVEDKEEGEYPKVIPNPHGWTCGTVSH